MGSRFVWFGRYVAPLLNPDDVGAGDFRSAGLVDVEPGV